MISRDLPHGEPPELGAGLVRADLPQLAGARAAAVADRPQRGLETSFEFVASICRIFELLPRGRKASLNGLSAYAKWQFGLGV